LSDADYYRIQTPGFLTGFTGFTVQLKTSGVSLLIPSLMVYDSTGRLVSSTAAVDPLHGDLTLTVNARPSSAYYLRVAGATASVWGMDVNGLQPRLHVFDAGQHPIAAQVIANGSGTYTVQLPNVPGNTSFYIEVVAGNPNVHSTGRFSLAVDFHAPSLISFGT